MLPFTHPHPPAETVTKYEIMDGAPVRGECIPIRLSLKPFEAGAGGGAGGGGTGSGGTGSSGTGSGTGGLSPSYANVFNKFSVRYFLNLVLVDEEDRRYFKQQVGGVGWSGSGVGVG